MTPHSTPTAARTADRRSCSAGPRARLATCLLACLAVAAPLFAQSEDFGGYRPHYQGAGTTTPGGRGGTVYRVTNLNNAGAGSLREALTAAGPRIVLFEVSGTIALTSSIFITTPFLTVAGQTAPSPGITVRNYAIYVDTHDVVFQHLRLRLGDTGCANNCDGGGEDVIYIRNNAWNIVLDHLSVSWGQHGGIDINAWSGPTQPYNIAVLDTIVSENLVKKLTPFATGTLLMPSPFGTATYARNLHAHNGNRNPWVASGWRFAGYNNVTYNPSSVVGDQGTLAFFQLMGGYGSSTPYEAVWAGNLALPGPNTHADGRPVKIDMFAAEINLGNTLYLADNVGPGQTPTNQWNGTVTYQDQATEARVRVNTPPSWFLTERFTLLTSTQVQASVLANAGARPLDRDAVDTRIVQEVTTRTGRMVTTPSDVGGYPVLAQHVRTLATPSQPNSVIDAAGRTRMDVWLEAFAQALEPARSAAPTPVLPKPAPVLPKGRS